MVWAVDFELKGLGMSRAIVLRTLWILLWGLMTIVCGAFAITAAEFYWVTVTHQTPSYASLLAWTVSEEFAFGAESGFAQMTPYWRTMPSLNQWVLGIHALLASVALVVGAFQFHPKTRTYWPRWHRIGGRLYGCMTLIAMVLAMVYLLLTPTEHIYGGAPFAVGLWGIAILTTYTLIASWVHIVRGEVVAHRTTMVLNFAAMLIAPLLRFWWMCLGWLFQEQSWSQETAHVAVLMFLGVQVVVGAIVVLHVRRRSLAGESSAAIMDFRSWIQERVEWWERGFWVAFAAIAVVVTQNIRHVRLERFDVFDTHGMFFLLQGLGLCLLAYWMPLWIRRTFHRDTLLTVRGDIVFLIAVMCLVFGWLGQAHGYGMGGVREVGSMAFLVTLAGAVTVLGVLWFHGAIRQDTRAMREMTLHIYALSVVPVTHFVGMYGFLWLGWSTEDAFLSAAVLLPPLHLSCSFYYTVYSRRITTDSPQQLSAVAQEPRPLVLASS